MGQSPAPTQPATPPPVPPGIFGVGFTNVTDSSARLVFTTSEPMSSTVIVTGGGREISRSSQPAFDEIHAVDLSSLPKGQACRVEIDASTHEGKTATSTDDSLTPSAHPASTHTWPGYTIFSTTISGDLTPAALDLLTQSGATMARIEPSWDGIFPRPHEINHAALDRFVAKVAALKAHHIEPLVILDYSVAWTKPYTDHTMTWRNKNFGPPDRLDDWAEYVRTVAKAFGDGAKYYEVWNEPDAGYLATGSYVERPNLPPPIGRPPYKDNKSYWLGDRYVPMIERARQVLDEVHPGAILMNGGWNRDYSGQSGDILFERGAAPYLDLYCFHCYSHQPISFAGWYDSIDGQFRRNIDRIFAKHQVSMPLAVTEWGWPSYPTPDPSKGFVSFEDVQKFYVKSTFYFLALQRVELLSQFCLGLGEVSDKDPLIFMLIHTDTDGKLLVHPSYDTFHWLAATFGSHAYRSLPVQVAPAESVKAYAIQLKDGDTYLAVWQDGKPAADGKIPPRPAQEVEVSMPDLAKESYSLQTLGLDGKPLASAPMVISSPLHLKAMLPEVSSTAESSVYLARITSAHP